MATRYSHEIPAGRFPTNSVKLFLDTSVLLAGCNSALGILGASCYGMPILLPSDFLIRERAAGRLR
jgi:hypothetical protein